MSTRSRPPRSALALAIAAAVTFLGSVLMLDASRVLLSSGSHATPAGRPGALLISMVALLGTTGGLLLWLATSDLLHHRRLHRARARAPRAQLNPRAGKDEPCGPMDSGRSWKRWIAR